MDRLVRFIDRLSLKTAVPYLLALTLFALPLSSSGKSIFLILSLLAILLAPNYRAQLPIVIKKDWCIAALLLSFLAVLACLWSPAAVSEKLFVVEKYSKMLYFPLLVAGFTNSKVRNSCLHAFMLAMLITSVLSIFKFHGYLNTHHINPEFVFRNRIMTGFMVAFASYLSMLMVFQHKTIWARLVYLFLTIIFTYQVLFVNGSRSGYIIYLLLMMLLVVQLGTWRKIIIGTVLVGCVFTFSYLVSSEMNTRFNSIVFQIKHHSGSEEEKNSSLGLRLQFHEFARSLFLKHPIIGNGTASFTYYFRILQPVSGWNWTDRQPAYHVLLEPHSLYWLVAAEFGLIGLLVLGYFFYTLFKASWHLKTMRIVAFGMLISFLVGNITDTLLFYSGSGYFFLLIMALCLGEQIETETHLNPIGAS